MDAGGPVRSGTGGSLAGLTVLITALMAVGTVTQFVFGTLGPFLVADLGLSRAQLGSLTTAAFAVAALLSPIMGHVTDRFRTRTAYSGLFLVTVSGLMGLALAPSFLVLLVFAGLGGLGQATVNPLSNKLVADHVPLRRQGVVMGVKQSGVQMAAVFTGAALPWMAAAFGWRQALIGIAALVLVGWLGSVLRVPERPLRSHEHRADRAPVSSVVLALACYAFLMGGAAATVHAYLPLYAYERVGLSPALAGSLIGALGVVGVGARILLGYATDRTQNATGLLVFLALVTATSLGLIIVAEAAGPVFVWAGAAAFGASVGWNAVAMIAVVKLSGREHTGKASGYVMVGFFLGFTVAPVAFGAAVDRTGSYQVPWAVLAASLGAMALMMLVWRHRGPSAKKSSTVARRDRGRGH